MSTLYSAILNPSGPNFEQWNEIFGSHRVPLESLQSDMVMVIVGAEKKELEHYRLNLPAMTLRQRANLVAFLAEGDGLKIDEVEGYLRLNGMPILAADVIVNSKMQAFV